MRIACIIPTYNGRFDVERLLNSLATQTLDFKTFIVDSSSNDGTLEVVLARSGPNLSVHSIAASEFNHGGTRQLIVDRNPDYDIYIYLTQDAYLSRDDALMRLIAPFEDPKVGAVCGRQLPHSNANLLAERARQFNYPDTVQIKSMTDVPQLGIKAAFMSNSFAAYRSGALKSVGGFPAHVIFAEDMYVAAKMLLTGWKMAYAGNAECHHSHNYTAREEFERYFDMGVFHVREPWIRQQFGGAGGEGFRYVKSELRFLGLSKIYIWPLAIFRNAIKLFGYKLGQQERRLSISVKRKFGMYKRYWEGPFAREYLYSKTKK